MKLETMIGLIKEIPSDLVICAVQPWTKDSWCILTGLTSQGGIPEEIKQTKYEYFLEISVAREIMVVVGGCEIPPNRLTEFLIHYAANDGFPDWANSLNL